MPNAVIGTGESAAQYQTGSAASGNLQKRANAAADPTHTTMPKKINLNDVHADQDVVMGDKTVTVIINMPGYAPTKPDLQQLRTAYLDHLQRTYRALDFKGIPQLETLSRELLLEEVYVPLVARPDLPSGETWERRLAGRILGKDAVPDEALAMLDKASAAPVRIEEALADQSRVVVIGDPGSGKSTLLKHLALRLAQEPDAPLPILVPLNAYASALLQADRNLQQFMPDYFASLA